MRDNGWDGTEAVAAARAEATDAGRATAGQSVWSLGWCGGDMGGGEEEEQRGVGVGVMKHFCVWPSVLESNHHEYKLYMY